MSWDESKWIVRNCKKIIDESKNKTVTVKSTVYEVGNRPVYPGDSSYYVFAKFEGVDVSKYNYCFLDNTAITHTYGDQHGYGLADLGTEKFITVLEHTYNSPYYVVKFDQDSIKIGSYYRDADCKCYIRVYENNLYMLIDDNTSYTGVAKNITATFM